MAQTMIWIDKEIAICEDVLLHAGKRQNASSGGLSGFSAGYKRNQQPVDGVDYHSEDKRASVDAQPVEKRRRVVPLFAHEQCASGWR